MSEDSLLMIIAGVLALGGLAAAVTVHLRRQNMLELAVRERERTIQLLTERFGSSPEFVAFANSREAAMLFATIDAPAVLARRLLGMAAAAVLLGAIGAGFWLNAWSIAHEPDINFIRRAADERWWGTLCLASSVGLGAAAMLSMRLARRWGLIGR